MSIPLDRLYHFVDSLCGGDIVIYRFSPHGSKKITDLIPLKLLPFHSTSNMVTMICHDQEPLDYDYYSMPNRLQELQDHFPDCILNHCGDQYPVISSFLLKRNIKMVNVSCCSQPYALLLHSEKQSPNLDTYERSGFMGVYWWSHAIIAGDWFRYAQHDLDLHAKCIQKDFLIYNRAWSGTREYRLKFAELLIQHDLQNHCMIRFNPQDNNQHYKDHVYRNPKFAVGTALENYFELNTYDSTASADYVAQDYTNTAIEIVLETLFDDNRWHLTEKILRPIACGQPFMLAATSGSLAYLRSYGFRTFEPAINETYDTLQDPVTRLRAIISEMRRIVDLPNHQKKSLYDQLRDIAVYNQQRFFSSNFQNHVIHELRQNLAQARIHLQGS
jgi:hypothetical protein